MIAKLVDVAKKNARSSLWADFSTFEFVHKVYIHTHTKYINIYVYGKDEIMCGFSGYSESVLVRRAAIIAEVPTSHRFTVNT